MRRLWNWFEGLVHFRLIFNRMQIKDLAFSDKCLIDRKWPLHYQLQDKRVLKTSLFSEGRLYQCISDGLNCCNSRFRSTAFIVWDVPREVVKYKQLWNGLEGLVLFSLFSEGWLYQLAASSLQQAVCILKCAVWIGHYTHTVCIIQYEVFIVQPTVCSTHLFPCK